MKTIILAGGEGTRLGDVSKSIPKPLIPIGDMPIIQHIINHYVTYQHKEFYICVGYLSSMFHDYFHSISMKEEIVSSTIVKYFLGYLRQELALERLEGCAKFSPI